METNDREEILSATRELLNTIIDSNGVETEDVASVIFTTTPDLNAEFPALAARQLGWHDTALMCAHEMSVPGSLPRCIRILVHWNTPKPLQAIHHVYIRGAIHLRPDRRAIELRPVLA